MEERSLTLATRLLLVFFLTSLALFGQKPLSLFLIASYTITSLLLYFYPIPYSLFLDAIFVGALSLVGESYLYLFGFAPLSFFFIRDFRLFALFLILVLGVSFYKTRSPLGLLPPTFLTFTVSTLGLFYNKKDYEKKFCEEHLKDCEESYERLKGEYANFEITLKRYKRLKEILNFIVEEESLQGFLKKVKESFNLKDVKVVPKKGIKGKELFDEEKGSFTTFVETPKGVVFVIFEFEGKFQLYDDELIEDLREVCNAMRIYLEALKEEAFTKEYLYRAKEN